jgi:CRISPR-associated endonuclease/helicase Cas3
MHQSFQEALTKAGFPKAREKQDQVFDAFRNGKHIILKAPTGWGKTFAVNAALGDGHHIYSLPLRVLVDSLADATNKFELYESVAHHGQEKNHPFLDPGNDSNNPVRLVYTTLDQTLSAFLGIPIGVSLRQGNILPAVIDNSHLIFDEFHLFEPEKSWTTALFALQRSEQNCVILTATLSDYMLSFIEEFLLKTSVGKEYGVEVIKADRPFVNKKELVKGDGFEQIKNLEIGDRTIIIRNDIQSAKDTAKILRNTEKIDKPVYLLHSELLSSDRKKIESKIIEIFGKNSEKHGILVATQVVEAGIDISCDVMHTDLCPPSSFIQRVGRNARYEGEEGRVIWHQTDKVGPYRSQKSLIHKLADFLEEEDILEEKKEQAIVNLSISFDKEQVKKFKKRNVREVDRLRSHRDYSAYREMIRAIDSKNVAIGTDLNQDYSFVSVSRSKFYNEKGFFFKAIQEKPSKYGVYDSDRREIVLTNRLDNADFILLDPEFVGYQENYGFSFEELGGFEKFIDNSKDRWTLYDYEYETYEEHINRLYQKLSTVSWMVNHLANHRLIGSKENANFVSRFLIWAHDLGKLTVKWQEAHQVSLSDVPIAHSEKEGRYQRIKRPPKHAWISAWIVLDYLMEIFGENGSGLELTKSIFWAIADHHGYSDNLRKEDIKPYEIWFLDYLDEMTKRNSWIEKEWNSSILEPTQTNETDTHKIHLQLNNESMKLQQSDDLSLYFMCSYILRKADQNATELVSTKKEVEKTRKESTGNMIW